MIGSRVSASAGWFVGAGPRPDAAAILFCLPYAGGAASAFRHWRSAVPAGIDLQAVQLPGRETRIGEPARIDPGEIAEALLQRVDRPYAIYGHSMGGRLAYEVIRELRRRRAPLPVRCYVGGSRPPDQVDPIASVARRSDSELVRRLEELGGTPAGLLDVPELRELLLPVLRADFEWLDTYRFQPDAPLPVPVVGFAGAVDPVVRPGTMVGWCRHTAAGFRLHTVPGDHFFLHAEASRVLELIAADLLPAVTSRRAGARPAGTPPSGGAAARLTPPEPDEVHIWLAAVDKLPGLARASAELSTSEAAHAARIHDETDRQRFVARRVLLRRLLRRYGVDVEDLPPGPHGRPEAEPRIRFCVSHSADLVLLGFATGQDIGVGVERVRPEAAGSGEGLLHPDEQAEFADLPDAERPSAALRTLAAKEAVLKAAGLRVEPSRFGFAGQSGEVWRPHAPSDLAGLAPWRVTTLALDGAFGAVAVTGRSWRLRFETVEIEEVGA